MTAFVDWIKPPEDKENQIRDQAEEIRSRIKGQAEADGLVVRSMPNSGSFAKRTGLRRHMHGDAEVEGQDVDLPFVVSPKTTEGDVIKELLDRFERYARASYPDTKRNPTKSSIQLSFVGTKLNYDLVPMLAVSGKDDEQILLRSTGERRRTSVQKHIDFIKRRTDKSNKQPGRVKFNECVRLVKWWREVRQAESQILEDVPSIIIDLLCAKAFDDLGVEETYPMTMARWFGRIASAVKQREAIGFRDYVSNPFAHGEGQKWAVVDPVNAENIVVPSAWGNMQIQELADWFAKSRDEWGRVLADDLASHDARSMQGLIAIFGNAFKHHGEV